MELRYEWTHAKYYHKFRKKHRSDTEQSSVYGIAVLYKEIYSLSIIQQQYITLQSGWAEDHFMLYYNASNV